MPTPLSILLIADEAAGVHVLRALARAGHELRSVVTTPTPAGETRSDAWSLAGRLGLPRTPAERVRDPELAAELREKPVDLILNVHSLYLLPANLLATARIGAFNVHPAPLPRYAGLNSVSWAIYRGETEHGVTLHWMEPGIDTGPIAFQEALPIAPNESALSLFTRCARVGVELTLRLVDQAARDAGAIPRVAQDLSRREIFARRQIPQDGWVDWSRSARQIQDFVRACDFDPFPSPWGFPRFAIDRGVARVRGARVIDDEATPAAGRVLSASDEMAIVGCGRGTLGIDRILIDERPSPAGAVLREGMVLGGRSHVAV